MPDPGYTINWLLVLIACLLGLVWGLLWAVFLQFSRMGRFLAVKRTWITVVIGVGVDLAIALVAVSWWAWLPVVLVIAASSLGIIGRSLYNELAETDETLDVIKNASGE